MLNLVSAHIIHAILETDFYLYSHNDCILQDFKSVVDVSTEDLKRAREMLCEYILKETIDRKGNF
jgi:nicotinic acid phosphoribosyltransferase